MKSKKTERIISQMCKKLICVHHEYLIDSSLTLLISDICELRDYNLQMISYDIVS